MSGKIYIGANEATVSNLIPNGNFENGIDGWATSRGSSSAPYVTVSSSNKIVGSKSACLKMQNTTYTSLIMFDVNSVYGHKYYYRYYLKKIIGSPTCEWKYSHQDGSSTKWLDCTSTDVGNGWMLWSGICDTSTYDKDYIKFTFTFGKWIDKASVSGSFEAYFDGAMLIDLTDCFGSGNEPTREWCDKNIPYGDGEFSVSRETSVAKNVKAMFVSPNGVAKKVRRAYIGVNGIAKRFFGKDMSITYKGSITPLSQARNGLAGVSIGQHMLFGGGLEHYYGFSVVDCYDKSYTRSLATELAQGVFNVSAAANTKYAFFAGGYIYTSDSSVVNAYDVSLTRTAATDLSTTKHDLTATNFGQYVLFAGGKHGNNAYTNTVDIYNNSLTKSTLTPLNQSAEFPMSATTGSYVLIAGGNDDSKSYTTVTAYNSSLTKIVAPELAQARSNYGSASCNGFAVFDGGYSCEFYNNSLTKVYRDVQHGGYWSGTGVGVMNEYAVFSSWNEIKMYDSSFTRQIVARTDLNTAVNNMASASLGTKVIIAGGLTTDSGSRINNAVAVELT